MIHPIFVVVVLIMLLVKKFKCRHIRVGRDVPITIKMFHKGNQEVDKGEIVAPWEREDRNSSNKLVVLARLRHQHLNLKSKNPDSSDPSGRAAVLRQRDYKRYFFFFGILWKLSAYFLIKTLVNFNKNFSKAHKNIADRAARPPHTMAENQRNWGIFRLFFSLTIDIMKGFFNLISYDELSHLHRLRVARSIHVHGWVSLSSDHLRTAHSMHIIYDEK